MPKNFCTDFSSDNSGQHGIYIFCRNFYIDITTVLDMLDKDQFSGGGFFPQIYYISDIKVSSCQLMLQNKIKNQ